MALLSGAVYGVLDYWFYFSFFPIPSVDNDIVYPPEICGYKPIVCPFFSPSFFHFQCPLPWSPLPWRPDG